MKKVLFIIFLFVPICLWAQEPLTLPVVPKEDPSPSSPRLLDLKSLILPDVSPPLGATPQAMPNIPPLQLPEAQSQTFEIGTHKFGGLNLYSPVNRLPIEQGTQLLNLIPEGFSAIRKRDGYEKINFTAINGVYGATIAQGTNPQIIVACADSLRKADSTTSWEFNAIDSTEDILTYFASMPFGVVILNNTDSARIWDGSNIKALGIADTGTFTSDTTDTEKAWTADYWIGYWVKCGTKCTSYFEILDNGTNWLSLAADGDTCTDSAYVILSRPDSVGSSLGYPIGQAGAYFQDRFFVSSAHFDNRIYYSAVRDPNDIPRENIINLDMDAHDKVVVMKVFDNKLFAFGKYSIYGINTSFVATPMRKNLGCVVPYSIALADDYIYFFAGINKGIYRMKPNIYGSFSFTFEKISTLIDDIIENIDPQNVDYCGGIYINNQYWFSYHPDSTLMFDERTQQWYGPETFGFTSSLNYSSVFGKTWGEILLPNADADTNEWTVSAGSDSHYYYIYKPDSLDKYLYTGANGKKDFFEFDTTTRSPVGADIEYLSIYLKAKTNGWAGPWPIIYIDLVANQQRYNLGSVHLEGYGFLTYSVQTSTNPITSSAWTKADIDSLKLAIRSYASAYTISVAALWVYPQYQGNLALSSFLFSSPYRSYVYKYGGIATDDTSTTGYDVYGDHVIANYQPGWMDGDLPVDDKLVRQFYLQTEKDTGDVWIYYYTDFSSTPSDSDQITLGGKRTDWWMLGEKVKGKSFSFKVENKSNVDSLVIKGWSALINNLGARGGE